VINKNTQRDIDIDGSQNKIVGGDDNSIINNYGGQRGKLSSLFASLKIQFENPQNVEEIKIISDSLSRYLNPKDTIGLEKKLENAEKSHLEEDFLELKQLFYKKLLKFQNYEPAQEIFTFLLAIVLERYRNIIKPMIRENQSEREILFAISEKITKPITNLLVQEGCDDIMGLNADDIEGMYHYLTGNCHINWVL
jgi:hypothetical protein